MEQSLSHKNEETYSTISDTQSLRSGRDEICGLNAEQSTDESQGQRQDTQVTTSEMNTNTLGCRCLLSQGALTSLKALHAFKCAFIYYSSVDGTHTHTHTHTHKRGGVWCPSAPCQWHHHRPLTRTPRVARCPSIQEEQIHSDIWTS